MTQQVGVRAFALAALFALWPYAGLIPAAVISAAVVLALAFFFGFVAPEEKAAGRRSKKG